jgi:hypothetical protein
MAHVCTYVQSIVIPECIDEKQFGGGGYGAKASAVLLQVRGKDFRHEKTKRKRGSYTGGTAMHAESSVYAQSLLSNVV